MSKIVPMYLSDMLSQKVLSSVLVLDLSMTLIPPVENDFIDGADHVRELSASANWEFSEDDEYLVRTFRALSAAYLAVKHMDFSKENILKAGLSKFKRLSTGHHIPIFKNHDKVVESYLGMVRTAYFENATGKIPEGINQVLAFDKEATPKSVIRGIKTGGLSSVSATVVTKIEKSHKDMDDLDFLWKLGQKVNGEFVRFIVTKIREELETSLVWSGADVFAKNKNKGKTFSLDFKVQEVAHMNEVLKKLLLSFCENTAIELPEKLDKMSDEDAREFIDKNVKDFDKKRTDAVELNQTLQKTISTMTEEVTTLTKDKETYDSTIAGLTVKMATSEKVATAYRKELSDRLTSAAALVLNNDESAAAMVTLAKQDSVTVDQLQTFVKVYEARAESLFPLKCPKCQVVVERRTSLQEDPNAADPPKGAGDKATPTTPKSFKDWRREAKFKQMRKEA